MFIIQYFINIISVPKVQIIFGINKFFRDYFQENQKFNLCSQFEHKMGLVTTPHFRSLYKKKIRTVPTQTIRTFPTLLLILLITSASHVSSYTHRN